MSGISMGHSHPRPCSGKKTLRRCRNKEEADNFILIDVDSENSNNVVIIDITESLPKKNQELHMLKKDEKWPVRNVINIDDDESPDSSCPFGVNNVSFSAGTSLTRESFRVSNNFGDSSGGDCQFVHDNSTPVRLSKCKRTYSGKASTGKQYGLDSDSECDLSDNDNPDYDLVEDFSGEVRAMWEKAFSRRMKGIHNVHSGSKGDDSTSHCIYEDHQNVESRSSFKNEVNRGKAFPGDSHRLVSEKGTGNVDGGDNWESNQLHTTGVAKEMECSMPECSFNSSILPGKATVCSSTPHCEAVDGSGKSLSSKSFLSSGKDSHEENEPLVPEIPFLNEAKHQAVTSPSNIDACIINDRERLKETEEYKSAMEEEWASRQQALQIQAEEAQRQRRLRKRIKAERMRLLDMERRQKQRLEEVRSIQKKDAENINLKDAIRAEIKIELNKLEVGCWNMASLLHSLGIRVDSWPNSSPQEVQAAYKRALLTFHPDRASRSDIRQMVEAEEKFKLINRMKEKFPPYS